MILLGMVQIDADDFMPPTADYLIIFLGITEKQYQSYSPCLKKSSMNKYMV